MLLESLISKYLFAQEGILADSTITGYKAAFKHLRKLLDKNIESITIDDLRALYHELVKKEEIYQDHPHVNRKPKQKGYSKHSLHNFVRCWKRLFNWAVEENYLQISPAKRLKLPQLPEPEPKAIQKEDLLILIEVAKFSQNPERDEAILRFLADSSARVGGAAKLKLKDLNLQNGSAIVREKGRGGGRPRSVFFNETTAESLQKWLAVRPKDQDDRLFLLRESGIYQMIERLAIEGEVTGPHNPHAFRHGYAIGMLSNGANLAQVSQLMGHKSVNITVAYYGQFPTSILKEFHGRYSWAPNGENEPKPKLKTESLPDEVTEKEADLTELITIPKSVEVARQHGYDLAVSTVYYAATAKNIVDANKVGRDWIFSRGEFLKWLLNRYQPKQGKKQVRRGIEPSIRERM